jgi:hypothetical protein
MWFHETIPKWTVNVTENKELSFASNSTKIPNQKDLLSEIDKKGECCLRKR